MTIFKAQIIISICGLLLFSCSAPPAEEAVSAVATPVEIPDTTVVLPVKDSIPAAPGIKVQQKCECNYTVLSGEGITLALDDYDNKPFRGADSALVEQYSHDSVRDKVTTLNISNRNFPLERLKVFRNVERVYVHKGDCKFLNYFPNLKEIWIFGGEVKMEGDEPWMGRVETINANKFGVALESLKPFRRLKRLYFVAGFVNKLPADIQELPCLEEFTWVMINYTNKQKANLSTLDFSGMPCLKRVEILTYHGDNYFNLPRGLENPSLTYANVHYKGMKSVDKEYIKKIKEEIRKRKSPGGS